MHVMVWEFRVRRGLERQFEEAYGPDGVWAGFFNRGRGYLGTELLRDIGTSGRYVTVDRWDSREAFEAFREERAAEYETIDRQCEALTESETPVGSFFAIPAPGLESVGQ